MKYKVNWHLDLGTRQHEKNDEIDMKEKDAELLVASGVLTPIGKTAKATGGGTGVREGDGVSADDNAGNAGAGGDDGSGAPQ